MRPKGCLLQEHSTDLLVVQGVPPNHGRGVEVKRSWHYIPHTRPAQDRPVFALAHSVSDTHVFPNTPFSCAELPGFEPCH